MPLSIADRVSALHERLVLRQPVVVLAISAIIVSLFGWYAQDFGLDASADSLTLERDEDLSYYRLVKARYGSDDYLIVTFAPDEDLFSDSTLRHLHDLRAELNSLASVESVVSILDVDEDRHATRAVALVDDLLELLGLAAAGRLVDRPFDVVGGHVDRPRLLDSESQAVIRVRVAAALPRCDRDLAGDLGEESAALGVGDALRALDRGPFRVT
jgi:hypothetical protein